MTPSPRSFASSIGRRLAACLVLAALASSVPVTFDIGADGFRLDPAAAHAKSGKGKDGTRDDDEDEDRDDDNDRDEDDDEDRDEREDDDRDEDRDDGSEDERNDGAAVSAGSDGRRGSGSGDDPGDVGRVELTATGINIIYRDGSREVLANGMYRREDASGRVLDSRAATGADLVRLRALAGGRAVATTTTTAPDAAATGVPKTIRLRGNDVIVEYTNGWTEAVERNRYSLKDRYGHVAVERAATDADRTRLRALAGR